MADERHPGSSEQPEDESGGDAGSTGAGSTGPGSTGAGSGSESPGANPPERGRAGFSSRNNPPEPPRQDPAGSGGDPQNPFEAFMAAFGGAPGAGGPDMNALMGQLQNAFSMLGGSGGLFGRPTTDSGSGVNWEITKDTARKTVAGLGSDPTPTSAQQRAVTEAVSIAEVWLDQATEFPRVSTTVRAWSRAEWIEKTLPVWRRLVEPVASHIADAMEGALSLGEQGAEGLPPGMAGMEQMLRPMLRTSGASMFGLQLGQGLGRLAAEVVGATDIGLPLSEPGHVALLPTNVAAFGEGLEQSETDVTLYLALRESARQRLFAAAPWLREQMLALVEQYARGITIDTSALEEAVGRIDPNNLSELSETIEGGLFEPQKTPEQLVTLERLETMLALVEGWVDDVVTQATAQWMPAAVPLAETVRRVRATGGPAEATFATLVGLELRPRRLRDAANLWAALREARGADGRDAVWSHPDLLPTSAALDDPLGFVAGEAEQAGDDDFDAALAELLDADAASQARAEEPSDGPDSAAGPEGTDGVPDPDGESGPDDGPAPAPGER